ncbi:MAG: recombination mediator RecR [Firmicutes bacterium]|nr:recombination mediator RecR [Bacillota bacterium]
MLPEALARLVEHLSRLPTVGPKTAQRLALHVLRMSEDEVRQLAEALLEAKARVKPCSVCFHLTEVDPCAICTSPTRDPSVLCVVEDSRDVLAIERAREFRGRYHVLGGAISPLDGVGPEDLRIRELLDRLRSGEVREVIVATNPRVEGDATALYLARLIRPLGIRVTRLAHGLPVGGDLEYAEEVTLARALEGRREL